MRVLGLRLDAEILKVFNRLQTSKPKLFTKLFH